MSGRTDGPWLVVVGMHRSGTSSVTGAIEALGFNSVSVEDRMSDTTSNPEHWESVSIALHNDAILNQFGGTWDAPPELPAGWEGDVGLPDIAAASELLVAAFPNLGPSVWKDPRVCLLLPYWLKVFRGPMAAVLIWRDPLAVARSLRRRNGWPLPYGVALWERYNRSAIANLAQKDVYVLDYDTLVEDPAPSLLGLTSWLHSIGTFDSMPQPWDHERALSVVTADLRHHSVGATDDSDNRIVLAQQRRLVEQLIELAGGHRPFPPLPDDESPWTEATLGARRSANYLEIGRLKRQLEHSNAERDWFASALADARSGQAATSADLAATSADLVSVHGDLASLKASSSWRLTAPARFLAARLTPTGDRRAKR